MTYDLNSARRHRERRTVAAGLYELAISVHPGGCGPDGELRLANNLSSLLLELELMVTSGENEGTSFRHYLTVAIDGDEEPSRKQLRSIDWSMQQLREILESHYKISPDDNSLEAVNSRKISTFMSFDVLQFYGMVGVEDSEKYGMQNKLLRIVMPGDREWPEEKEQRAPQTLPPLRDDLNDEVPFALAFFVISAVTWLAVAGSTPIA
jgi:hypothetical protein